MAKGSPQDQRDVPWIDIVRFIRQLSHDLRNHLNAAELQSAYVNELARDVELKSEIKRMREMISELGRALQKLSADVGGLKPELIKYPVDEFVEDLRNKIGRDFAEESAGVHWEVQLDGAPLNVDPQLLQQAFVELFANAFLHDRGPGNMTASARIDSGRFVFTLSEPKTRFELSTEAWGREPLRRVGHGHYGLGLSRARSIVGAHNGDFEARYDPKTSTLTTTIRLPLSKES